MFILQLVFWISLLCGVGVAGTGHPAIALVPWLVAVCVVIVDYILSADRELHAFISEIKQ